MSAVQQKTAHVSSLASPAPSGTVPSGFQCPDASSGNDSPCSSVVDSSLQRSLSDQPADADVNSTSPSHQLSPELIDEPAAYTAVAAAEGGTAAWVEAVSSKASGSTARSAHMLASSAEPAHPLGPFHDFPDSPQASGSQQSEGQQGLIPLGDAHAAAWAHLHRSPTKTMAAGPSSWTSPARSDVSAVSIGPRGSPMQHPRILATGASTGGSDDEHEPPSPDALSPELSSAMPLSNGQTSGGLRLQLGQTGHESSSGNAVRVSIGGSSIDSPTHSAGSMSRAVSGLSEAASISPRTVNRPRTARALLSRLALPADGAELVLGGALATPSPSGSASEASWSIAVPNPQPAAADSPTHEDFGVGSPPAGTSTAEWAGFRALASSGRTSATRNSMAMSLDGPAGLSVAQRLPAPATAGAQAHPAASDANECSPMSAHTPAAAVTPATALHDGASAERNRRLGTGSPTSTQSSALFATPMAGFAPTPSSSWRGPASSMASGSFAGYATPMGTLEPPTPCSATPNPNAAADPSDSPQALSGQYESEAAGQAPDQPAQAQAAQQAGISNRTPASSEGTAVASSLQTPDHNDPTEDESAGVSPEARDAATAAALQTPQHRPDDRCHDSGTALLWCHETIDDDLAGPSLPVSILGPPPIYPLISSPTPVRPPPTTTEGASAELPGHAQSAVATPQAALHPFEQVADVSKSSIPAEGAMETAVPTPAGLVRAQSTPGSGDWYRRILRTFDTPGHGAPASVADGRAQMGAGSAFSLPAEEAPKSQSAGVPEAMGNAELTGLAVDLEAGQQNAPNSRASSAAGVETPPTTQADEAPEETSQQEAASSEGSGPQLPPASHDMGPAAEPAVAMQENAAAGQQPQQQMVSPTSVQGQAMGPGRLTELELPTPGVLQAITNTHSPSPGAGGAGNPWEGGQSPSPSGGGEHSGAATGSWWSSSSASNSFKGGYCCCTLN